MPKCRQCGEDLEALNLQSFCNNECLYAFMDADTVPIPLHQTNTNTPGRWSTEDAD